MTWYETDLTKFECLGICLVGLTKIVKTAVKVNYFPVYIRNGHLPSTVISVSGCANYFGEKLSCLGTVSIVRISPKKSLSVL
jgi:hypothetical protein